MRLLLPENAAFVAVSERRYDDRELLETTMPCEIETPRNARNYIGEALPPSGWVTIDQKMIDTFAEATGDDQWIHVDVARAARELPEATTIAHGYLILSLLPRLLKEIVVFGALGRSINYGSDRVRFTAPIPAGARVRLRATITSVDDVNDGGARIGQHCEIERESDDRPVLVADIIRVLFP